MTSCCIIFCHSHTITFIEIGGREGEIVLGRSLNISEIHKENTENNQA